MDKMDFTEFMKENDFHVEGRMGYGTIKGYPVLIKKKLGKNIEISFYLEENPWNNIREKMLDFVKLYKASAYYENEHLVVEVRIGRREYYRFTELLEGVVRILRRNEVPIPTKCVICGEDHADAFAIINEDNQPVHRECLQRELNFARHFKAEGNYLTGFLGAFLGCLVGCLPCIISLLLVGKTYCVLFLLIPPAVYNGCKLLKGKMNYYVFVLSILFSFLSVYIIELVLRVQYNLQLQNLPCTIGYCFEILRKLLEYDGIFGILSKSGGLDFVFVLMGILINWELISQTSLKAEEDIVSVMDTINYAKKEE